MVRDLLSIFMIYYCSKKTPLSLKYVAVEEEKETTDEEAKTIGTVYLWDTYGNFNVKIYI